MPINSIGGDSSIETVSASRWKQEMEHCAAHLKNFQRILAPYEREIAADFDAFWVGLTEGESGRSQVIEINSHVDRLLAFQLGCLGGPIVRQWLIDEGKAAIEAAPLPPLLKAVLLLALQLFMILQPKQGVVSGG